MIVVKLWLHISPGGAAAPLRGPRGGPPEGLEADRRRLGEPGQRAEYEVAVEEMFERTDRPHAPWYVIAAESKRYARVEVVRTVIDAIEAGMRKFGQEPPDPG